MKALEEEVAKLEQQKKELEEKHKSGVLGYEKMKKELEIENQKLMAAYKEKDKEFRLCQLKIKELQKLKKHAVLKPIRRRKTFFFGKDAKEFASIGSALLGFWSRGGPEHSSEKGRLAESKEKLRGGKL